MYVKSVFSFIPPFLAKPNAQLQGTIEQNAFTELWLKAIVNKHEKYLPLK